MSAKLTVERGNVVPPEFDLGADGTVRLGRETDNNIRIKDRYTSRYHAEIARDSAGGWVFVNLKSTNKTHIDGAVVTAPMPLRDGAVIDIGEARLRFHADAVCAPISTPRQQPEPSFESESSTLLGDALTTLLRYMDQALLETTPNGLIEFTLNVARRQTGAELAGFLSLGDDAPEPLLLVPDGATVSAGLSQRLSAAALEQGKAVWLGSAPTRAVESESLSGYIDAVCVPVLAGAGRANAPPLGALHLYRTSRPFIERDVRFCEVLAGHMAGHLRNLRARRSLEAENSRLRGHLPDFGTVLVGDSQAMRELREQIALLADASCPVWVHGESGVGKELVALALHHEGFRADQPFEEFNCPNLVTSLAESELFGHEADAFNGARQRAGLFQCADGGTLFLDEIGDLPLEGQAKLLRVLEQRTVKAVGSDVRVRVNVRVVSATNRNLEDDVRTGRFRRDLFYRLGTRLEVPPLRDHLADIPLLVDHFLEGFNGFYRKQVSLAPDALARLQDYSWPGNVRQLRTVIEIAVVQARNRAAVLAAKDVRLEEPAGAAVVEEPTSWNLNDVEAWAIRRVVTHTTTNVEAARELGINRETLILKMRKYGIERDKA
jgi:Nif-specific regulatory protein